ncbi:MAG: PH domain-containing protein [Bacteroidetes bacterium]|nr:MAG: PH domain-containing protein [Bacteroidota bacterium]
MISENKLMLKAEFNPKIKTYIFITIAFFLLVTVIGIPILIVWLLGLGQYISKRYYENMSCELTTKHLEFKKGVLFKVEKTIPLENIQDLTFIENPLLKYLDLRILKIETAGHSNPQGSDMKLVGIIGASDFKKKVLHQRELLKQNERVISTQTQTSNEQINNTLIEIRDILNEIKNK